MVYNERDVRHEHVIECAKQMMTAARTAPKAKGVDIIEIMMMTDHITGFKVLMKVMRNSLKTWNIMRMKSADWN